LRRIDLDSGRVETWAGSGRAGHAGENVPAHEAGLFEPMSMLRLQSGDVLTAALRSRRIYSIGAPAVLPVPWWRRGWALTVFALGFAVLAIAVVRVRTHRFRVRTLALERAVTERSRELAREEAVIRRQAAELETRLDAQDRLLARVSHEFRTPLAVILGPTRRLGDGVAEAEIRGTVKAIEQRATRLLRLVEQLLNIARLSHGYRGVAGAVPAVPVVRRIVAAHESRAFERGQRLRLGRLDEVAVHSSVVALEAVIGQVLSDAIERTVAGGEVTVSVADADGEARIAVLIDGSAVGSADADERSPAGELDDGATGLPFVTRLVAAQGGTVSREEVAGAGSMVMVRLPKANPGQDNDREMAAAEPGPAPPSETELLPRATVLVIEDNADLREYLSELLARDYRCLTAADGERGLNLAREIVPDLVVCDVMLPGCDGFEVCRTLKRDEVTCHVPVVLLTALDGEQHRLHGLEDGADDYLTKPFEDDVLRARVAGLLEIRALLRRRYAQELLVEGEAAGPGARDRAFLDRLARLVEARHTDAGFELAELAGRLAMSDRQVQRKIRALLGVTPAEYLRDVRLQKARSRLLAGERPSDVAIAVGFGSHAYFATCFRAQFGHSPSETRRLAGEVAPAKDPVAWSKTAR
jgi:DNA-binding response OmpR family regulator/signal transduction histidine kinase